MNPSNRTVIVALTLTAMAVATAMGCKKSAHIDLAPTYVGPVNIVCDAVGDTSGNIAVDAFGNAEAHTCPPHNAELVVLRNGKPVSIEGPVEWQTTGDGIVVGIHFNAR